MDREDQGLQGLPGKIKIIEQVAKLSCVLAYIGTGIGATIRLRIDALTAEEQILDQFDVGIVAQNLVVDVSRF